MPAASCWGLKEDEYLENRRLTPPESFWQYDSSLVCRQLVFSMDSVHKLHLPSDSRIASTELFSRGHTSWINYWAEPYLDYSVVCEENVVSLHSTCGSRDLVMDLVARGTLSWIHLLAEPRHGFIPWLHGERRHALAWGFHPWAQCGPVRLAHAAVLEVVSVAR